MTKLLDALLQLTNISQMSHAERLEVLMHVMVMSWSSGSLILGSKEYSGDTGGQKTCARVKYRQSLTMEL